MVSLTNLPKKLDDPGKFSIPCATGKVQFDHALCDLGASVSIMPKSIFEKIGVGELKPTHISLQMADHSIKLPIGVVEDMPIRVGQNFIPIDFVIVEMEEDSHTPLLFGRSFLNTAKAIIDVHGGKISFTIGGDKVIFNVNRSFKYLSNDESNFLVDIGEEIKHGNMEDALATNPLEEILENSICVRETGENNAETSETSTDDAPKVKPKPVPATLQHENLGANKTNHNGVKSPPLSTSLTRMEPPRPSISTLQGVSNSHKIEELLIKLEEIKKAFETTIDEVVQKHILARDMEESWNVRTGAYKD